MILTPSLTSIQGFLKIFNPVTGEVFVDKKNAIHYENISIAMAQTLACISATWVAEIRYFSAQCLVVGTVSLISGCS